MTKANAKKGRRKAVKKVEKTSADVSKNSKATRGKLRHAFPCTDAGNAEIFVAYCEDYVRFDHQQQRWLVWNRVKRRWVEDKQGKVHLLMKQTARQRAKIAAALHSTEDNKEWKEKEFKWAVNSENRYRIDAALELAKSEPPISDSGEGWDSNPWLFGVANGIVDLRTGKLRQERPEDRVTKHSPVRFDPDAKCPRDARVLLFEYPALACAGTVCAVDGQQCATGSAVR